MSKIRKKEHTVFSLRFLSLSIPKHQIWLKDTNDTFGNEESNVFFTVRVQNN